MGNIERATKCWSEGDDCLAYIHLVHAGLQAPRHVRAAAYRLFVTDRLMRAGVSPRAIFEWLEVGTPYIDAFEKLYNPDEPRVPAGSGRTSGQWTRDEGTSGPSLLSDLAMPAGLRYAWNRDETLLHLTYDDADGERSTAPYRQLDRE